MNEIMGEFVKMLEAGLTMDKSDTVLDLLDELRFMVEQVDMAQVFAKFGGFQCLLGLVECENISDEARALAASTLAALTQNNITVQEIALNNGMLDRLAKVYIQSTSAIVCNKVSPIFSHNKRFERPPNPVLSTLLCSQVLYALSCSVRNHQAAEEYFMLHFAEPILPKAISGLNALSTLADAPGAEALVSRALFLCNALIISDFTSPARITKLKSLLLPLCLKGLESESLDLRETTENLMAAINSSSVPHEPAATHYLAIK
jgi:hypothetical protein